MRSKNYIVGGILALAALSFSARGETNQVNSTTNALDNILSSTNLTNMVAAAEEETQFKIVDAYTGSTTNSAGEISPYFAVEVPAKFGHFYTLQTKDSLTSTNAWEDVLKIRGRGQHATLKDDVTPNEKGFYRVIEEL